MARAIPFTEAAIPTIAAEAELSERDIRHMYVARPETDYLFVIDFPYKQGEVGWAMVPDFTFNQYFEFDEPAKDDAFVSITKITNATPGVN